MARKVQRYAQALVETLKAVPVKERESVIKRFHRLVLKRGDLKLLSSVVKEAEKQWESGGGKAARLIRAKRGSSEPLKKELETLGYVVVEEQDERLIGGAAAFLGNDYVIDNTVKGRLRRLQSMFT